MGVGKGIGIRKPLRFGSTCRFNQGFRAEVLGFGALGLKL